MPRIAKNVPTRRLNLEMSQRVRERLERLRDQTGADSLVEVIRRSLAVYELLWSEQEKGGKLVVRRPDGDAEMMLV